MPPNSEDALIEAIRAFAVGLPAELVQNVAAAVDAYSGLPHAQLSVQVLAAVAQPNLRSHVRSLLDCWLSTRPELPAQGLALALRAAAGIAEHMRREQTLELVWTGPDSEVIPLRRTDQTLLHLIRSARHRLLIVSFAVYKVQAVAQALLEAARRQVKISIVLETPSASEGKVSFDMAAALGPEISQHARFYVWPLAQRPVSPSGQHGSLHAKVAMADGISLLVSSANLTEYAMTLNMELGLLIRGGEWPLRVERHFVRLIESKVLQRIEGHT